MNEKPKAPRFDAYWAHSQGLPVIIMNRSQWDLLVKEPDELVTVDISETPMHSVESCVTACIAKQFLVSNIGTGDGFIHVFRYDPADGTTPINTDKYNVWMGSTLQQQKGFMKAVAACGTTADSNLAQHLNETVYLVKQEPDDGHHLEEVPSQVKLLYQKD